MISKGEIKISIFKLKPSYKDYIWGGTRLKEEYNKNYNGDILAETWELSSHKDGESYILLEDKEVTLSKFIETKGKKILGTNCEKFDNFPILVKFIDAKGSLSIQVHPKDSYALKNENSYGKTEMWYVMDCDENSFLYYGFKKEISKEEFVERIENETLLEVLNKVSVKKGDVFFIEAGTIHGIGENITIAEIQQNSNLTYRVFDYGRVGLDGKKRELHIDKAVDVTTLKLPTNKNFENHLASCEYFTVDKVDLKGEYLEVCDEKSFVHMLIVDGDGSVECSGTKYIFKKGDSYFIPANSGEVKLKGEATILVTRV